MIKKRIWASILFGDTILNVLFILIISSAVLCGAKYYLDMSKTQRANADISAISTAIAQYELEIGKYPDSLQDLTSESGQYGPWLKEIPSDVFSKNQHYKYLKDKKHYIVYSVGPDGTASSSLATGISGDDIGYKDN